MTDKKANCKAPADLILVVEDNRALREGLSMNLTLNGYRVITAKDGEEGMQKSFDARPDLIILDISLPVWSGLEILQELRTRNENMPVLILSAHNMTPDKVTGLNLGADDYMTKPFNLHELLARIASILRRQHFEKQHQPLINIGEITIAPASRQVTLGKKKIELSTKEFDILLLFAKSPGQVFTRDIIIEKIWGWDYEGTARTVDNFISSIRKKLNMGRDQPVSLITIPKMGYKLTM